MSVWSSRDYYGSFDWDHNYVSIWGPKPLSSLPEIAETPECDQGEFLLQKEFLRKYRNMCTFPSRASETMTHEFPIKFMNILDPLRNDNNLGRSVNIANLHRVRFALSYGARRLKQILTLPGENLGAALEKFFFSTLDRNGKGERADVVVSISPFYRSYFHLIFPKAKNYNSYWDMHTKPSRPRRFASSKYNALPKSPSKKQQAEEVHSLTDINANSDSRLFEFSSEDSPLLLCNCKVILPTQAQESTPLAKFHSETDMDVTSQLLEFSNEDFPLLPKVYYETHMEGNSRSFELSKKDFPLLQSTDKTSLSDSAAKLTKQAKSFPSSKESKLKNIEFGTFKKSQSLIEPSLSTKGEREDSGVPLSQETVLVVPKVAAERKDESP
ncbi:hypothetical protein JHK82_027156 [Glycine max]|nr:hypothetical protein JHK82_027156 [Glycine max]